MERRNISSNIREIAADLWSIFLWLSKRNYQRVDARMKSVVGSCYDVAHYREVKPLGVGLMNVEVAPIWQANWSAQPSVDLPAPLLDWLLEAGSLTARLQGTGHAFALHLLTQQQVVLPDFLQQRWHVTHGLVREVVLSLDAHPCIYAQSFLPDPTVAALQPLAQLGSVPLGHYIFTQPGLTRSAIELANFPAGLQLPSIGCQPAIWGRRSFFTLDQHELLVQELYLPALMELISA